VTDAYDLLPTIGPEVKSVLIARDQRYPAGNTTVKSPDDHGKAIIETFGTTYALRSLQKSSSLKPGLTMIPVNHWTTLPQCAHYLLPMLGAGRGASMHGSQVSLSISLLLVSSIYRLMMGGGHLRVLTACASTIAIELGSPALEHPAGRYRLKQQAILSSMQGR